MATLKSAIVKIEFPDRIEIRHVRLKHNLPFGKKEMEQWLKDELGNDVEVTFLKGEMYARNNYKDKRIS